MTTMRASMTLRLWGTLSFSPVLACVVLSACAHAPSLPNRFPGVVADRADTTSSCSDSVAAFRRVVSEFQSRQQNAAISVGVRYHGATVFREATGRASLEGGIPADAAMAFSIASVTKAFTGVALLKLVETGQIDLDAEIQRYVPDFPRHPSGRPVTLRMLAHHLGAVRHWGPERDERLYVRHFDDVHDILALFRDDPWVPGLTPLTRYSYSSYGYNAIAMAIQNASRTSLLIRAFDETAQAIGRGRSG
jgi:serine beta-lactamase-like protein LACTB, mitochondrial